jgi:hypothetical protein
MRDSPAMRIQVLGDHTISQQARTDAEYRVFAALTQLAGADHVRGASVVLRHLDRSGDGQVVTRMDDRHVGGLEHHASVHHARPSLRCNQPRRRASQEYEHI